MSRLPCIIFAVALLSVGGCQSITGQSPAAAYVDADRQSFNAIAPEYSAYVAADPSMSADAKARRQRTLGTWRLRIETAVKEQTTAQPPPPGATVKPIP